MTLTNDVLQSIVCITISLFSASKMEEQNPYESNHKRCHEGSVDNATAAKKNCSETNFESTHCLLYTSDAADE